MSRPHRSFENFALLQAASEGSASAVRDALEAGADINASDTSGRTVLTCALTADRWETVDASDASFMSQDRLNVIRIAVSHPDISLFTLNAPQDSINDVTPLGMAAWLDMPDVVQLLLEYSSGAVSVDGVDTDGATPLMYAARDYRMEVVQQLLSHGSRPDLRDRNHRSSIQFALPHPSALWACEYALRCDRWREYNNGNKEVLCEPSCVDVVRLSPYNSASPEPFSPPATAFSPESLSRITDSIVNAVLTADLSLIYTLLFSPENGPILVNVPDAEGWSAIHYCASVPNLSIEILDALYRAGADVSLFTTWEHYTPLHCLARLGRVTDASNSSQLLYRFAVHLIRDLHAPLSARDRNEETCIHLAAEHGDCIDVLYAFLDCDPTGSYRNLRNSRGLTALEVAKPQFRTAFMTEGQFNRPESSLSDRTIRPNTSMSLSPITSFTNWVSPINPPSPHEYRGPASHLPPDFDITTSSEQLLDNFQYLSAEGQFVRNPAEFNKFASVVQETAQLGDDVLAYFRGQIDDATMELRSTREILNCVDRQWNQVSREAEEQLSVQDPLHSHFARLTYKDSPRGSEDSQSTAVGSDASLSKDEQMKKYVDAAVLTETISPRLETTSPSGARVVPWPEWLDNFILSADSSTYKAHLANLIEIERELFSRDCASSIEEKPTSKDHKKFKALLKSYKFHSKIEKTGASKLKAWLKKKIVAGKPLRPQLCYELDDPRCAVGRQVKQDIEQPVITVTDTEGIKCRSRPSVSLSENGTHLVLFAASRDLSAIDECLHAIDHLISTANHFVSRAERIIKRTVRARGAMVENLRSRYLPVNDPFAFWSEGTHPLGPYTLADNSESLLSLSPLIYLSPPDSDKGSANSSRSSSAQSSVVSLAMTLREEEDEDTRALRRLLLRKISAHVDGAFDEVDRGSTWLSVVKTVLRDLSTRISSSTVLS
ncbi:hypothetical protein L210DRAFT_3454250 [Boletus edulis BED1]|uniref:Ankyrin n=1 Tax=Boletus edulis BED1 TaxID=1328754 RepID=A0AAD4GB38_BOLED|nr:hypothetical protein L210DRAFT_3454250 [Boletus edulis BED1]